MINKQLRLLLIILVFAGCSNLQNSTTYIISNQKETPPIYLNENVDSLILWAANDFADDIEVITGNRPKILKIKTIPKGKGIYIGEFNDVFLKSLNKSEISSLYGEWENFHINVYQQKLIISGSDIRGTVYGIFEVAERLGISPWKWWADVNLLHKNSLTLEIKRDGITENPSVQYRGIFLNDEDWGLQPWAAKTFEQETNDIGPKTYEKIFQLLLRLKANTIWPAMHPCTKAFYKITGNNEMAKKYHIVVGTSHCEPMLRNNVDEWDRAKYGDFNYFTNKDGVCQYWNERIEKVKDAENIVTLGMRGIHDGHMHGGNSLEEKTRMVEQIINDQRQMLVDIKNKPIDSIATTIVLYKEVLDLYNKGMKVPDDVTIMWCDDNYGYIRRLSNKEEQKRVGGSGVYYHLSYWGTPHDYLWLSTSQPGLIWYEMSKAYQNGARKMWIANVGDIKPCEYNMEFFLNMAWDIDAVNEKTIDENMQKWAAREFGEKVADKIVDIKKEYYRLASIRKPEFMGWSRVEPQTSTTCSQFNPNAKGNELKRRINMYNHLFNSVNQLKNKIPKKRLDAWFQLVEYPIKGACLMNNKFLYFQLSEKEADTLKHNEYLKLSKESYEQIVQLTLYYNVEMSSGKWEHMMSMAPRNLNVFKMPSSEKHDTTTKITARKNINNQQRIFIQANEYKTAKGNNGYTWITVEELGYSNNAITLYPLDIHIFNKKNMPYVEYIFEAQQTGWCELKVRCLPTHSNNFNHQLTIQINNAEGKEFKINSKGKSEEWKVNILRNSQIVNYKFKITKAGNHTIRIYANQTGIVLDQISVDFVMNEPFYEIPFMKY